MFVEQSQHAEKLLEINEAMLERDKALKLELDVATSLNKDMTMRLAMTQRTIKQLNEKVAALDATEAANRQQHEAALHEKVECTTFNVLYHWLNVCGNYDAV